MKRFLCISSIIFTCACVNAAVIWQTGFEAGEGYALGTIDGQQDWHFYDISGTRPTGMVTSTVIGGAVPEGTQCLWLGPGTGGWSAVIHPLDISEVDTAEEYITIALKARPDADYCELQPMEIGSGYSNLVMRFLAYGGNLWISATGTPVSLCCCSVLTVTARCISPRGMTIRLTASGRRWIAGLILPIVWTWRLTS